MPIEHVNSSAPFQLTSATLKRNVHCHDFLWASLRISSDYVFSVPVPGTSSVTDFPSTQAAPNNLLGLANRAASYLDKVTDISAYVKLTSVIFSVVCSLVTVLYNFSTLSSGYVCLLMTSYPNATSAGLSVETVDVNAGSLTHRSPDYCCNSELTDPTAQVHPSAFSDNRSGSPKTRLYNINFYSSFPSNKTAEQVRLGLTASDVCKVQVGNPSIPVITCVSYCIRTSYLLTVSSQLRNTDFLTGPEIET